MFCNASTWNIVARPQQAWRFVPVPDLNRDAVSHCQPAHLPQLLWGGLRGPLQIQLGHGLIPGAELLLEPFLRLLGGSWKLFIGSC